MLIFELQNYTRHHFYTDLDFHLAWALHPHLLQAEDRSIQKYIFFTKCFHAIVLWMVEFTGSETWPSTVTAYYNPEFNGGILASWYLLKLHWPEEFFKLLWEWKPRFMQTHPVHGLIFSLPPGSPELLVPSTIIQVIDLNFKSPLHFQFQQKIKITQRKNLAIINSAAMNIGVLVSLSLLVFSVCMPSSGIANLITLNLSSDQRNQFPF